MARGRAVARTRFAMRPHAPPRPPAKRPPMHRHEPHQPWAARLVARRRLISTPPAARPCARGAPRAIEDFTRWSSSTTPYHACREQRHADVAAPVRPPIGTVSASDHPTRLGHEPGIPRALPRAARSRARPQRRGRKGPRTLPANHRTCGRDVPGRSHRAPGCARRCPGDSDELTHPSFPGADR